MNDAGKGDSYRPVNYKIYSKNWDKIFGLKKKPKNKKLDKRKK